MPQLDAGLSPAPAGPPLDVDLRVLGPLEGRLDGRPMDLGPARRRVLLAVLLAHAGRTVALDSLVDALWEDDPPGYAVNVVHKHIGALRRLVEPELPRRAQGRWLLSSNSGYRIDCDQVTVDVLSFRSLVARAATVGDEERLSLLVTALELWRGPAGAGIGPEARHEPVFTALDREHVGAAIEAAELALKLGSSDRVLPALGIATRSHPTDELLAAHLVRGLASVGQRAEALERYEELRTYLVEELGVEPGEALRSAQLEVLRDDGSGLDAEPPTAPSQVPAGLPTFTGREAELDALHDGRRDDAASVVVVTGPPGVGKTSLALRFANQVADGFGDGRLYVDLRGFDPHEQARSPAEVLTRFLQDMGVPDARIPNDPDARAALFRSTAASRRLLVVLDNAGGTEQVLPLLPGTPGSLVIVTSRVQLRGIAAGGALAVPLDRFDLDGARDFLAARLGEDRVRAEPDAVRTLSELCGGLPLALALAAARIAHLRGTSLQAITEDITEDIGGADRLLDLFTDSADPRTDIRSVFSWSYDALPARSARLFRLVALLAGPTVTVPVAAALADVATADARRALDELEEAGLLVRRELRHYDVHDLLKAYAAELLDAEPPAERDAAEERHYARAARIAAAATNLHTPDRLPPLGAGLAAVEQVFGDAAAARVWLDRTCPTLVELVLRPSVVGRLDAHVWVLACVAEPWLGRRGQFQLALEVQRIGIEAAERAGLPLVQSWLHRGAARSVVCLGRARQVDGHVEAAMTLLDRVPEAPAALRSEMFRQMSWVMEQADRFEDALEFATKGLNVCAPDGPDRTRGNALNAVAWDEVLLGRLDSAYEHACEAVEILTADGEPFGLVDALATLGAVHFRQGRLCPAVSCYRRSAALAPRLGYPLLEAEIIVDLGRVLVAAGHPLWARGLFERAHSTLHELGHHTADEVRDLIAELD